MIKSTNFKLLILLTLLGSLFADEITTYDDVPELTGENFLDTITSNEYVLVEFYATWCGYCKTFAPIYAEISRNSDLAGLNVSVAKVKQSDEPFFTKYRIGQYPTILLFVKGFPVGYYGERTEESIVNWIKFVAQPLARHVNSYYDLEAVISENYFFALHFSTVYNTNLFEALAKSYPDIPFLYTDSTEIKNELQLDDESEFVFFKKDHQKGYIVYKEEISQNKLSQFINNERFPTISTYDQNVFQRVFQTDSSALFLITEDFEANQEIINHFKKAAINLKDSITLVIANYADEITQQLSDFAAVTKEDLPAVIIIKPIRGNFPEKHKLESTDITQEVIEKFVSKDSCCKRRRSSVRWR